MEKRKKFNRIKSALADKDIQNQMLAEHIDVTEETVSRWCNNSSQPSIKRLFEIADYLKIDVRYLLVSSLEKTD